MRSRNLIVIGAAVFIGLLAMLIANSVFTGVEENRAKVAEQNRLVQIVVASQELAFGTPVTSQNVRLANWPATSVPAGAFTSLEEATKARVALRPIVVGEPVLATKVSGANGRATLSANLPEGQLAFSVPIDAVSGAGGFVRPGDVVDVIVTRKIPGQGASESDKMSDVVLQGIPVLGIDQVSDENNTQPVIAKTATLQVDAFGAQKLALAQQLGVLTLALRNNGDTTGTGARGTVTGRDITASRLYIPERRFGSAMARPAATSAYRTPAAPRATVKAVPGAAMPSGPTMTVVRGTKTSEVGVYHGY